MRWGTLGAVDTFVATIECLSVFAKTMESKGPSCLLICAMTEWSQGTLNGHDSMTAKRQPRLCNSLMVCGNVLPREMVSPLFGSAI